MTPYEHGFLSKCAEYGVTERIANNMLNMHLFVKFASKKLKFKEIADIVRNARKFMITRKSGRFSMLSQEGDEFVNSALRPKLTKFESQFSPDKPNSMFAYADPKVRKKMFPRFSIFKGSRTIDGQGGMADVGFGHSYSISGGANLEHDAAKGLFTHVAQDPRQAELYGDILNVWNAKKIPGVMNGNMRFFGNTIAETHATPDFTQASGLYRVPKGSGHRSVVQAVERDVNQTPGGINRRMKLDTTRPDYLDSFGDYSLFGSVNNRGEAEGLVDISRYKPSRTFYKTTGGMLDITPIASYRRTLKNKEDIEVIDAIIRSLQ